MTYKLTITCDDFNTSSYAANNNEKTSKAVCTTDDNKTFEVKWTSYQVYQQSSKMQWQKNKGYIYNSTNLGTITNIIVTSTAGTFTTYYGDTEQPSSNTEVGGGFFKINVGDATGTSSKVEITFNAEDDHVPSFTLTAMSNNDSYGTVSVDGSTITAMPEEGYRVSSSNPYSVTTGTATVTQNGNVFTVSADADCTVQINFELIPCYTVTLSDDTENPMTESSSGAGVTLPSRDNVGGYTFAGWSTDNVTEETTKAPTIIPAGTYNPTSDVTLYPVYTRTESGAVPSPFKVGNTGDFVIVFDRIDGSGKYFALPANPTVSNGKITAGYVTVSEAEGVKYVTPENANGYTWTIASATNGYTLSDGSKYLYHSNGGASGTDLEYGTGTTYTWSFTIVDDVYVQMAGMSGSTVNSRGMLLYTSIGGYALSNWETSGYYKTMILPVCFGSTSYYWSEPVAAAVERPVIELAANPFLFSTTATITCETDGATIYYSYDNETWTAYTEALTITETKTIYAKATKDPDESRVASVTAIKNQAEPVVTISDSGITNRNLYVGTAAGSLSASVTYEDAPVAGAVVTWSGDNNEVATINETTGAVTLVGAGKVTFTATFAGNDDYSEQTATYVLNVTNIDPDAYFTWVETELASLTSSDVFVIVGNNGSNYAMTNDKGTSSAPAATEVTVVGKTLSGTIDNNLQWNISGDAGNGYVFYPNGDSENWLYCINDNNGVRVGKTNDNKAFKISNEGYLYNTGRSRYVGIYNSQDWRCYTSINSNIENQTFKFYKKVDAKSVTVTSAGYATYCSEMALDFTGTGITAYYGTAEGSKLTFKPITKVPANTGVLLVCAGGTTVDVPTLSGAADVVTGNILVGVTEATTITKDDYILNVVDVEGEKKAGFFLAGTHTSLAANRAYIPASVGAGVKSFVLDLEDDADGIKTLSDSPLKGENIYNLAGQRLSKMQKGINIVNGKKILK